MPAASSTLDAIFKAYDVRGLYPDEIDEDTARRIGNAFAAFTGAPLIVVARDMRTSSGPLSAAFIEGATLAGADVVDAGLASTDLIYYASGRLDAPGAMFTASHNPAQYNGIKLCRAQAAPVGQDTGLGDIKAAVAAGRLETADRPGTVTERDLVGEYAEHVRGFADPAALRPLKVVADTANGMGGLVVPRVFEGLPFELTVLFPELDGNFPNHPADPIQPENLRDLQRVILEQGADVGLAFDGDADRVFLVDDRAEPLSGSVTTAIVAKGILARNPGETVVHNLICSKVVPEVITEMGGTPVRTRVGHSFIKATMAETGAIFGGEHSGHFYFRDFWRADSGMLAALHTLAALSETDRPLSELMARYERYPLSGEINSEVVDTQPVLDDLEAAYADRDGVEVDHLDGLTVSHRDWTFNVRPSNT
ncbi:MAG: phosphomannomutase/phosphoglucomutase, partial [Actinomycetota bacterium]|nr:phosphomannomutase/phosphoglucomutase [Actinomycetota bacterium]